MYPRVVLEPRSGFELALGLALLVLVVASVRAWRVGPRLPATAGSRALWGLGGEAPITRLAALFGAYFGGALLLLVAGHAALGARPFAVSMYAVWLLVGALCAWKMLLVRLPEAGLPMRGVYAVIAGCLLLGVVGSRLAELAADGLAGHDTPFLEGRIAGLGVFGALALDALYVTALLKLAFPDVSVLLVLDAGAAPSLLNVAFARVGCLFAGCCYGARTHFFLAFPASWFDPASPARTSSEAGASLWPTQPLEAALAAGLAWVCHTLWLRRERFHLKAGAIIGCAAIGYGVGRFLLELVRGDSMRLRSGLTIWQYCALALVLVGLGLTSRWGLRPQAPKEFGSRP